MNKDGIIHLANELAAHENVTHWAISSRIFGKGNFFQKIMDGGDCYQSSADRASRWFAENWPDDLPWPDAIDRPARQIDEVA